MVRSFYLAWLLKSFVVCPFLLMIIYALHVEYHMIHYSVYKLLIYKIDLFYFSGAGIIESMMGFKPGQGNLRLVFRLFSLILGLPSLRLK